MTTGFLSIIFAGYRFTNMMDDWIGFQNLISHNFHRPFVTRPLIPWIARALNKFGGSPELLFNALEILGTFMAVIAFEKFLSNFIKQRNVTRPLSIVFLLVMPFFMLLPRVINLWYPYDIYALLFNIILLHLMYKKNFIPYYIIFAIATFNRETTAFITITMLFVYFKNYPFKKLAIHLIAQFIIWMIIRSIIEKIFSDKGGGLFEHNFFTNMSFIYSIFTAGGMTKGSFGKAVFHSTLFVAALSFIFSGFYVVFNWKNLKESFLKRAFLVFIPYYGITIIIGNIFEYRILSEMVPFSLVPAMVIIYNKIRETS